MGDSHKPKLARELKKDDRVLVGSKERRLTKVSKFEETTALVELSFEPDLPVESFMVPDYGMQTRGEPLPGQDHDWQMPDCLSLRESWEHFSEEDLKQATPSVYED